MDLANLGLATWNRLRSSDKEDGHDEEADDG